VSLVPPRARLTPLSKDDGHVIAAYNPLIVVCFTRPPRDAEIGVMRHYAELGLAGGVRGGFLYIVARKNLAGGVDPHLRKMFENLTRKSADRAGATAVVLLTEGFVGALVRGVIASFALMMTHRHMLRVFGAIDGACGWLAAEHALDREALVRAVHDATSHLEMPARAR
jgi:hypothetical protein